MILGMDISRWEDDPATPATVDFIKAKQAGVEFCFARASYGLYTDVTYAIFRKNCKGVMPFGAYHYLYAESVAAVQRQAEKFIAVIQTGELPELPLVLDWENEGVTWNMAYQWITLVRAAFPGKEILIYSRKEFLDRKLPAIGSSSRIWFQQFGLWLAYYNTQSPVMPTGWGAWELWQYTDRGDGPTYGMPQPEAKAVDLNWYNGTREQFYERYLSGVVIPPSPPTPPPPPPPSPSPLSVTGLGWVRPRYVRTGPAIVVGNPQPRKGNYVVPLREPWHTYIKRVNDSDPARWKLFTAPDVGPTKGLSNGKLKYIMHTWSGGVVKILARQGIFVRIMSISSKATPPDPNKINHVRTPWLVHTMTMVDKNNGFYSNPQAARNTCRCPIISLAGVMWVPAEWIMPLDACRVVVKAVVAKIDIHRTWSLTSEVMASITRGQSLTVTRVVGDSDGNLWGQVDQGWACIRLRGVRQTNWWI